LLSLPAKSYVLAIEVLFSGSQPDEPLWLGKPRRTHAKHLPERVDEVALIVEAELKGDILYRDAATQSTSRFDQSELHVVTGWRHTHKRFETSDQVIFVYVPDG
jgi:hypothetical protein